MKDSAISESFKRRADSSSFWEAWCGSVLARNNLWTLHHPFTLASEIGVPLSFYASSWDLDVSYDSGVYLPVEVKSTNISFTSPRTYPHKGVLVCSDSSWTKKWGTQDVLKRDFLIVSRTTGDIVWVPKGAPCGVTPVKDKTRNEKYLCRTTHASNLEPIQAFVDYVKDSAR